MPEMNEISDSEAKDSDDENDDYLHCLELILLYANWSGQFISAYAQGLSSAEAVWVNHRYHGHHTLPPDMVQKAKSSQKK
jgi:hypothetical protein